MGQIILPGVPAGVCVPQHGHFPQPTSLGSQGEISGVLALYIYIYMSWRDGEPAEGRLQAV